MPGAPSSVLAPSSEAATESPRSARFTRESWRHPAVKGFILGGEQVFRLKLQSRISQFVYLFFYVCIHFIYIYYIYVCIHILAARNADMHQGFSYNTKSAPSTTSFIKERHVQEKSPCQLY